MLKWTVSFVDSRPVMSDIALERLLRRISPTGNVDEAVQMKYDLHNCSRAMTNGTITDKWKLQTVLVEYIVVCEWVLFVRLWVISLHKHYMTDSFTPTLLFQSVSCTGADKLTTVGLGIKNCGTFGMVFSRSEFGYSTCKHVVKKVCVLIKFW